ncbi:translation initiation factor IF-3 [Candidatus Velamenicoccus archaeovorus]|uniref:Translation initiation factor IF-3 n=1 Tax=Velamenicoccus archaeovorus TaxID=1930593 RepID=A0A410P6X0_VELA1|nr:translation initiation factor IF-3 [Candidatus Velamenicoccus archaeovorus]
MKKYVRVNEKIRAPEIRVIGPNSEQLGIVSVKTGLDLATKYELDLVEVAPQVKPPVCRIMDFSKYKYEQEKREREAKKHQKHFQLKEIRVKPNIEEHDYHIKLKHMLEFLKEGNKVKVTLMFRGREMAHKEIGRRVVDRFVADAQEAGVVESGPMFEGRFITIVVAPK